VRAKDPLKHWEVRAGIILSFGGSFIRARLRFVTTLDFGRYFCIGLPNAQYPTLNAQFSIECIH